MMGAEWVMRVRGVAVWVIRAVGVVLLFMGVFLVLDRTLPAIYMWRWDVAWGSLKGSQDGVWGHARVSVLWGVGLVLLLASRRLARLIIAVPDEGCPKCGYPRPERGTRCPECGLGSRPVSDAGGG